MCDSCCLSLQDELEVAVSVGVSPDGTCIYAGSRKYIRVFDVNRPGRQVDGFKTHERRQAGQAGIISCFAFLPENQVFAAGSYSRSGKYIYTCLNSVPGHMVGNSACSEVYAFQLPFMMRGAMSRR